MSQITFLHTKERKNQWLGRCSKSHNSSYPCQFFHRYDAITLLFKMLKSSGSNLFPPIKGLQLMCTDCSSTKLFEVHLSITEWFHLRKELSRKIWMWSLSILKRAKNRRKRGKKNRCNKQREDAKKKKKKKIFQNWTRSKKLTIDR